MTFRTLEISDSRFSHDGLRFITVKSAALRGRADITLWVPPLPDSLQPMPITILLHGVYGSHWSWALQGGAHRTAQQLISSREVPPMVLAMPSDGLWGDGSGYIRQTALHRGGDFERWIVEEVPAAVAQAVPTAGRDQPVFIAGLSMGGFGALRLAAKFPGKFAAASGHSSITHFDQLARFVEEPLDSYGALPEDRSVLETILANRDALPPVRFDCGANDPLIEDNRTLHDSLIANNVSHEYAEHPGGHEWSYWEAHLSDTLCFFATVLKS
jgi:putative tributyrin esterase